MHSGQVIGSRTDADIEKMEITRKKGSNRTESDEARLRELECFSSIWWTEEGDAPTIPETAVRSCIEAAARKIKQGTQVREGLIVIGTDFHYDVDRYGSSPGDLAKTAQYTVGVMIQRNRIARTRAKFDTPWSCDVLLDTDPDLIDRQQLDEWFDIAGRRIGLGDWRPEKSGVYGRFTHKILN